MNQKSINNRKEDHIRINKEEDVQSTRSIGLDRYYFVHNALPEISLEEIKTSVNVFGKQNSAPIFISSMTGGTKDTNRLNTILATAAQEIGIGMGVGSQRISIENKEDSFSKIRRHAPDIFLMANIGAVQLNYGLKPSDCERLVGETEADALILHLNPLQEAIQPEGDTNFSGLLKKIDKVCTLLEVPVIVKEVGWGISKDVAKKLKNAGISAIDVAGAGGTSWSQVEKFRLDDKHQQNIAESFRGWGISTAQSIIDVKGVVGQIPVFASGGLRHGIDVAKCLNLGADYCGFAGKFFRAAMESEKELVNSIREVIQGLRICMFAIGASNVAELKTSELREIE